MQRAADQWRRRDGCPVSQGWDVCEDELLLTGWARRRRVIVMRRMRKSNLVVETQRAGRGKARHEPRLQGSMLILDPAVTQSAPVVAEALSWSNRHAATLCPNFSPMIAPACRSNPWRKVSSLKRARTSLRARCPIWT
jgi:hypothetical protein